MKTPLLPFRYVAGKFEVHFDFQTVGGLKHANPMGSKSLLLWPMRTSQKDNVE